jgi:hypothetical protein
MATTVVRIYEVPGSNIGPQISFHSLPITGALLSTPRNTFTRSYSWVVGFNTLGTWMYVNVFPVFMLSCIGRDLTTGRSTFQAVPPTVYKIVVASLILGLGKSQWV